MTRHLRPDALAVAAAFFLGALIALGAYVLVHQPAYLPCLPGSRGNICYLPRSTEARGGVSGRYQRSASDPLAILQKRYQHATSTPPKTTVANLDANTIAVPSAKAVPSMVTFDTTVWLRAEGFPPADALTLTLTAPDGTSCAIPSNQITSFGGASVQAFATPASCAAVAGEWMAIFSTGTGTEAIARFYAVTPG